MWQADLYPDTRSTEPSLTAEQFAEGKNAPPKLVPVNPGAAEIKPKIQVAKKANILAQMPHTVQEPAAPRQQESTPRSQPSQQRAAPRIDDDMGIVRMEQPKPSQQSSRKQNDSPPENAPNPMIPRQQVQLKAREERDQGAPLTSGQKRAALELDRYGNLI